jgi:thiamine-phosphate pyrophosphorylase
MHINLPKFFVYLDKYDKKVFENSNTNIGIIYRNYQSKKREVELIRIAKACKKKRKQLFVSNDIRLAVKVKAAGIYIPSFNKNRRFYNLEKKKMIVLGSAHNQIEIQKKIEQNCSAIFLSPLFYMKKNNNFLGMHSFNYLTYRNKINFFALGGISLNNINKLKHLNIVGFGGISIFQKKTGL